MQILKQRLVKVDGKTRTDTTYPAGFMDVIDIDKTDEHFRLVYDAKGRFVVHRISKEEAAYKLCKVKRMEFGKGGVPYIATHDGRTIRYPDPDIKVGVRTHAIALQHHGGTSRRGYAGHRWDRRAQLCAALGVPQRCSARS